MKRFNTMLEAAEFAATFCKSWSFATSNSENPADEDSFYVVSPSGAIGFCVDGKDIDWLFRFNLLYIQSICSAGCTINRINKWPVLNAKDYFRLKDRARENVMKHAVKPAYFVPETVRTDVLFRNMKQSRNHFAIVLDEYGGMSGIITMNDLLEQLVGDLEDDIMQKPQVLIERVDSQTWKIHGLATLKSVSEQLGVMLPEEDYDTFGGFVFGILGFIPEDGSTPELEGYGLIIKVIEIKEHQLEKAVVCLESTSGSAAEPSEA